MSKKKPMRLVSPAIPEEDLVATSDDEGPPFMDSGSSDKLVSSTSSQFVRRQAAASGLGTMDNSGDYGTFIKSENSEISITAADGAWTQVTLKNLHKREQHATTDFQTLLHIIKGNIGSGLLALPATVRHAGYILGPIGLLILGIMATHCMVMLIECAHFLYKKHNVKALNYAEVAQGAVLERTRIVWLGKIASYTVNFFLIVTQFGFCIVYFVFMAENIEQVMCEAYEVQIGVKAWIAVFIPMVVVACWIRDLDTLSIFSGIANVCVLLCLVGIFYAEIELLATGKGAISGALPEPDDKPNSLSLLTIHLFIGGAVYAFEGIGVVLPAENKMKNPHHSKRMVILGMSIVTVLYAVFGCMGYLTYGGTVKGSVTLNLQGRDVAPCIAYLVVKLYFTYIIFATYLLQFYVPMDFLEPPLFSLMKLDRLAYYYPKHHAKLVVLIQLTLRSLLVLITAALALIVPLLDDLISLVGAFASTAVALIIPPVLELLIFWNDRQRKSCFCLKWPLWIIKDAFLIIVGVLGFVLGTYGAVQKIVVDLAMPTENVDCDVCLYDELK